jgi:hypothetical protein
MGSKATEDPSILAGAEDDGVVCLRRRPAFVRGIVTTSLAAFALETSIMTSWFSGSTHPVFAFGIPLGRLADNVFHVLSDGEYSQIEVGSW